MISLSVKTSARNQMLDITRDVEGATGRSGVTTGFCVVYSPHTTAAVTINEGHDPAVVDDILAFLGELVPHNRNYRHMEGNSDSHIKVALLGPGQVIPVENGRLTLGTWQRIFLCEFDGPRTRTVQVSVTGR